jgi:hypothetical protein
MKTIATSIQMFGEVVVESKPCELTFVRKKEKQAQILLADLSPTMFSMSIIVMHLLLPHPDETATLLLSLM